MTIRRFDSRSPSRAKVEGQAQGEPLERVRKLKLAHAHVLAAAIYRHAVRADPGGANAILELPAFQRHVILSEAKNLGFMVQSRAELSPLQLGVVCSSLRRWMDEHGIEIPRSGRRAMTHSTLRLHSGQAGSGSSLGKPSDEQLQIIFELAGQALDRLGWTERYFHQVFVPRQLHGRREISTAADAHAVLYGLKGALRHHGHPGKEGRAC